MKYLDVKQEYTGLIDKTALFLIKNQLSDKALWRRFANQFRLQADGANNGWRGEYWGKMMRGGVLVYEYSRDEELFSALTETVKEMLTLIEPDGRISSYSKDTEFRAWDLWCRKYVMLGLEYYLDICRDEGLKDNIIAFLTSTASYIMARVGNGDEKTDITQATSHWLGLNSSSILEPMVRLYKLTGDSRVFDFCKYVVNVGGSKINVFELAYENQLKPYQYGVPKAYEMMSCFEGLLEYYLVTGIEKYKLAVINFAKAVIETEISVIGASGCTHELFDHTKARQTQQYEGVMQETCVTVTWIKLCSKVYMLTGEAVFLDEMERSFYNAYLGAVNTHMNVSINDYMRERYKKAGMEDKLNPIPLPFDSYSPLTPGKRGRLVGGFQILEDGSYYGCCVCIGSAGMGIFAKHAILDDNGSIAINFYENGKNTVTTDKGKVVVTTETNYPADGNILINIESECAFTLKARIPSWTKDSYRDAKNGYLSFDIPKGSSAINLSFDTSVRTTLPEKWDMDVLYTTTGSVRKPPVIVKHCERDDKYVSLSRGPLILAADTALGKPADSVFTFKKKDGCIPYSVCKNDGIHTLKCEFTDNSGNKFHLVDYASAGKNHTDTIAAWLPTE